MNLDVFPKKGGMDVRWNYDFNDTIYLHIDDDDGGLVRLILTIEEAGILGKQLIRAHKMGQPV